MKRSGSRDGAHLDDLVERTLSRARFAREPSSADRERLLASLRDYLDDLGGSLNDDALQDDVVSGVREIVKEASRPRARQWPRWVRPWAAVPVTVQALVCVSAFAGTVGFWLGSTPEPANSVAAAPAAGASPAVRAGGHARGRSSPPDAPTSEAPPPAAPPPTAPPRALIPAAAPAPAALSPRFQAAPRSAPLISATAAPAVAEPGPLIPAPLRPLASPARAATASEPKPEAPTRPRPASPSTVRAAAPANTPQPVLAAPAPLEPSSSRAAGTRAPAAPGPASPLPRAHRAPPAPLASADASPTPATPRLGDPRFLEAVRLVQRAQRSIEAGAPNVALSLLDELDARFPAPLLNEERLATRVLALCATGAVARARKAAAELQARSPSSIYAARIAESCAGAPPAPRR